MYKGRWTKDLDFLFSSIVLRHAKEMKSPIMSFPRFFIQALFDEMNAKSGGKHFSVQEIKQRLRFYKARYDTFKVLVANNRVQWVPKLQLVTATDEVWVEMIEQDPFVGFYYHRDEPMLKELSMMFGLHDAKVEPPTEVIQISSKMDEDDDDEDDWEDDEDAGAIDLEYKEEDQEEEEDSEDDEDEVNSPVPNKDQKTRRKLFVYPTTLSALSDRMSTTMPPPHKSKQPSKLYPIGPPRPSRYSPGVSSCASSSPESKAPQGPK